MPEAQLVFARVMGLSQEELWEWIKEHLNQCSDPAQAFQNWMERDIQFGLRVRGSAEDLGLRALVVDGKRRLAENLVEVENWLCGT